MTTRFFGAYFGEPWPSGVCEDGTQVETPIGENCEFCGEPIEAGHQGTFVGVLGLDNFPALAPVHKECSLRSVLGGIGHQENHVWWCKTMHDPDGGRSYRQSALEVWDWVQRHNAAINQ